MRKKQSDPYQGTALTIVNITDAARFKHSVIASLRHTGNMSFIRGARVSMVLSQVSLTPGDGTQKEEYAHSNMAFVHAQAGQET